MSPRCTQKYENDCDTFNRKNQNIENTDCLNCLIEPFVDMSANSVCYRRHGYILTTHCPGPQILGTDLTWYYGLLQVRSRVPSACTHWHRDWTRETSLLITVFVPLVTPTAAFYH
ncbi:hypothetical protein BaRGS_00007548 [Batillaria attramentaria]|uniref:Uncharacterized protein n=1 Tax=Batillaria attramentaria TaxID=370345 RepID=A0ABD0LPX6_9CAEN